MFDGVGETAKYEKKTHFFRFLRFLLETESCEKLVQEQEEDIIIWIIWIKLFSSIPSFKQHRLSIISTISIITLHISIMNLNLMVFFQEIIYQK